jgi:hypothetical protein
LLQMAGKLSEFALIDDPLGRDTGRVVKIAVGQEPTSTRET